MFNGDKVLITHSGTVSDSERVRYYGSVEGAPYVDDAVTAFKQRGGILRDMLHHARRGGFGCLIDVHACYGSPCRARGASTDGMVEDDDAVCTGDGVEDQFLDFRVVYLADAGIVCEIVLLRVHCRDGCEGIVVESEVGFATTHVADLDVSKGFPVVALRLAFWGGFDKVEGFAAVGRGCVVGERCCYGATGNLNSLVLGVGVVREESAGVLRLVGWCWLERSGSRHGGFREIFRFKLFENWRGSCYRFQYCSGERGVGVEVAGEVLIQRVLNDLL